MKNPLSLRLSVSLAFLFLGIVLVLTYSAISRHFFYLGMDNIMSVNMENAARIYITELPKAERNHLNSYRGYDISHDWEHQPDIIKARFSKPKHKNKLYKYLKGRIFQRPEELYFLIQTEILGESLYISVNPKPIAEDSVIIGININDSKRLLFYISSSIIFALALVIWLILRRVSKPVTQLACWTHSLTPKTLNEPAPNFHYPELNEMARLIKNSLSSAQKSLEREEQFLSFASHELRTPISVIRNNIELLDKIRTASPEVCNPKFNTITDRIGRASLTMKYLSETLLWLSRENNDDLSTESLAIDLLIEQLAEESRYLLKDKQISLAILTEKGTIINQPEHPVRIVIGNLIRNAFQHTQQGEITINQQGNVITIINESIHSDEYKETSSLGFGLGLELTSQLAEKLNWKYETKMESNLYKAKLAFNK
jgi:signal transduction histidine kinase